MACYFYAFQPWKYACVISIQTPLLVKMFSSFEIEKCKAVFREKKLRSFLKSILSKTFLSNKPFIHIP